MRKSLFALAAAVLAVTGPVAVAEAAKPKSKCSAVKREFFPWECR